MNDEPKSGMGEGMLPEEQPKLVTCKRCGKTMREQDSIHTCTPMSKSMKKRLVAQGAIPEEQNKGSARESEVMPDGESAHRFTKTSTESPRKPDEVSSGEISPNDGSALERLVSAYYYRVDFGSPTENKAVDKIVNEARTESATLHKMVVEMVEAGENMAANVGVALELHPEWCGTAAIHAKLVAVLAKAREIGEGR